MRRIARHPLLVVCLSIAFATGVFAQQDFSKVEIKTTKLAGNLYTLEGQGGAIGVLAGPDGVLMVDSQFAPLTEKIVAAIKAIDPAADPVSHQHARARRPHRRQRKSRRDGGHDHRASAAAGSAREARSHSHRRTRNAGARGGAAAPHLRCADDVPHERRAGTADSDPERAHGRRHAGEVRQRRRHHDGRLLPLDGYPNIDRANGGSLPGMLAGLNKIIELAGPSTKILPGHGAIVDKAAVAAHRDMIIGVRDKVAPMVKKGMTVDQVTAAKPTSDYDAKMGDTGTTGAAFRRAVVCRAWREIRLLRRSESHRQDAYDSRDRLSLESQQKIPDLLIFC